MRLRKKCESNGIRAGLLFVMATAVLPAAPAAPASAPQGQVAQMNLVTVGCAVPSVMATLGDGDFARALVEAEACRGAKDYPRLKGQAFHGLYQADSAIHYLRLAAKTDKDDAVAVALAEALLWKKETKESVALLDQVKDKGTPSYYKAMATRFETQKKFPKALEMYDKAIAIEKVSFGTRFRKAMLLSWMKKLDASIALYTTLIESPGLPPGFKTRCVIRRAEVMSWNKDLDKAAAELTAVVAKEPGNAEGRLQLGQVMEWQGRFKEAKDQYRDVLVSNPENAEAKRRLEALLWVK